MSKNDNYKITGDDNLKMLLRFYNDFEDEDKKKDFEEDIEATGDYFDDDVEQMKLEIALSFKEKGKYFWSDDQLVLLLSDKHGIVKYCASGAFYDRKISPKAFRAICDLQYSKSEDVRNTCIRAFGGIYSHRDDDENAEYLDKIINIVLNFAEDKSEDVRVDAIYTLSNLQEEYHLDTNINQMIDDIIFKAAKDKSSNIRNSASLALGSGCTDRKKVIELLNILRLDEDEEVVEGALLSLEGLFSQGDNEDIGELSDDQEYHFSEAIEDKNLSYEDMVEIALKIKQKY